MNKEQLLEFIKTRTHMVLSTVNAMGLPESAVVGFGVTDDLQLIFGTSYTSRKAQNVANNKNVSAVIGWDRQGTVQYEGTVRQLEDAEVDTYTELYFAKNTGAKLYKDDPSERYFLISPRWIRFTDVTERPWEVTEFNF